MIRIGRILGVAALLSVVACSDTAPTQVVKLSDNSHGIRITCGGWFSSVSACYDKASYVCNNRGYTVLQENDITPPESPYFWNSAGAHEIIARCGS